MLVDLPALATNKFVTFQNKNQNFCFYWSSMGYEGISAFFQNMVNFLRWYFFKKIESIIFPSRNIVKAFSKENFLEFYIKIPTKVRLK